ncbi:MAG: hypothetical protein JWP57_4347 [Spirosoma sp.]|nr:hypothetical protein [Spirosoma sp.]
MPSLIGDLYNDELIAHTSAHFELLKLLSAHLVSFTDDENW